MSNEGICMTTQEMKCILTLADTMNFSKAAEELNITQPAFSRIILRAEQTLGLKLFNRNTRLVSITEEGKVFIASLRQATAIYEAGIKHSRAMLAKDSILRIGCAADFVSFEVSPYIINFSQLHPDIYTECTPMSMKEIPPRVRANEIDIGFLFTDRQKFSSDFSSRILRRIPLNVVVNTCNPLAERNVISPLELENENIVVLQTNVGTDEVGSYGSLLPVLNKKYGLRLKEAAISPTIQDKLLRVACNQGICLLTATLDYLLPKNTRMIPTDEAIEFNFTALWKKDQESRTMTMFLEGMKNFFNLT